MSNINNGDDDEGYKRFLAFLASSPNPEEKGGPAEGSCPPPLIPLLSTVQHQDRSNALSRPKLQAKKEEKHLKSEPEKLEPAEMKKGAERLPSRPLSLQRSSCTMAPLSTNFNLLSETAAVERPPRAGQHPDYPFENVVFQGGGAKVRVDHIIYHMTDLTLFDTICMDIYVFFCRELFMLEYSKRLKN